MKNLFALALAAAISTATLAATPALADWEVLGTRTVNLRIDRDVISLGGAGPYTRIQLLVRGNGVFFENLRVVYGNGEVDDLAIRAFIPEGGQTRAIDLRGPARFINRVVMRYRSVRDGDGRAVVVVRGFRP